MKELYKKLCYCLILLIIFIILTLLIKAYFKPFFIIVVLVFIGMPVNSFISKLNFFNNNKKLSSAITIAFINILLIILFYYLGNFIYEFINEYIIKNYISLNNLIEKLCEFFNINIETFNNNQKTMSILNGDMVKRSAQYTIEGIVAYFISNIAVYFILVDKYDIFKFIQYFIPRDFYRKFIDKLKVVKQMLIIELILVLFTSLETILGLIILQVDNAFILGIACGLLDILPYVGTIIVFIPLIAYNFLIKKYFTATGIIILYIFVQVNRQILETKFISNKLSLHPLLVLISIYISIKLFGIIGFFIGPLYIILVKEILVIN